MKENQNRVRMAEYHVTEAPGVLVTIGLGSCVGVALYDKYVKLGGLIHIMLPENKKSLKPAKYADTGIPLLIKKMLEIGAKRRNIVAKIAGGARMFNIKDNNSSMQVGKRNFKAVRKLLKKEKIKLVAEDVGKNYGRTMKFYTEDGRVIISSHKKGTKTL